jgi:hypothetical protein
MTDEAQTGLLWSAKAHWRRFTPAWVFPLVFLFGGTASDQLGHPQLFFAVIALPLFFWSFFRASSAAAPWLHVAFWAVLVPFLIWTVAVFARLWVLNLLGAGNAV